jgi:hypothetical protein
MIIKLGGAQPMHKEKMDSGVKVELGGILFTHGEEMDNATRIESRGAQLMCKEETKGSEC